MATYLLTPKNPDPLTGQKNSYVGWHFIAQEALSIFAAMPWLKVYTGWDFNLSADPENPALQILSLTKYVGNITAQGGVIPQFQVRDTQWFIYDNGFIDVLDQDYVATNYDVATYQLPAPPAPANAPAPEHIVVPDDSPPPALDPAMIPPADAPPLVVDTGGK